MGGKYGRGQKDMELWSGLIAVCGWCQGFLYPQNLEFSYNYSVEGNLLQHSHFQVTFNNDENLLVARFTLSSFIEYVVKIP